MSCENAHAQLVNLLELCIELLLELSDLGLDHVAFGEVEYFLGQ